MDQTPAFNCLMEKSGLLSLKEKITGRENVVKNPIESHHER